ncbi:MULTISPECIES: LamB/YcsF family protein [Janibacter]|uniref:LamB/YcsF family protein n=1 Tax=Janibacter TaxID=53457 RepID=UPI00384F100F
MRAERGVVVAAQVSYRDLAAFGRRFIDVDPAGLTAEVVYQVGALRAFAEAVGVRVAYVKPHGALKRGRPPRGAGCRSRRGRAAARRRPRRARAAGSAWLRRAEDARAVRGAPSSAPSTHA